MNDATDGFPLDGAAHVPFLPVAAAPRASTSRVIADALRTAIVEGTLAPGAPLRQDAIARHFSVSAIPVREALRQLESEGWAKVGRAQGGDGRAALGGRSPRNLRDPLGARESRRRPRHSAAHRGDAARRRKSSATPPRASWTRRSTSPATRRFI